jgi:integrase/recombinase XerD
MEHIAWLRGNYAPGGAAAAYNDIRAFYTWLVDDGSYGQDASPMEGIKRPKCRMPDVEVLSEEQLKALLATCAGKTLADARDKALVLLMLDSGLRRREVTTLDTDDIDVTEAPCMSASAKAPATAPAPGGRSSARTPPAPSTGTCGCAGAASRRCS